VAVELLATYPDQFNNDYDHNKEMVGRLTDVQTDIMRNRIAGYLTCLKRKPVE